MEVASDLVSPIWRDKSSGKNNSTSNAFLSLKTTRPKRECKKMSELIDRISTVIYWLTKTTLGVFTSIICLIVIFIFVAALSERKTRKLFPDKSKKKSKSSG